MYFQSAQTTIGILYPGEMGSTFEKILAANGFRVVTKLEGRSSRTACLCRDACLRALDSLADVLERSDIVMSFVPPGAALSVVFFFQAEDGIRALYVTGVQTCALPI